MKKPRKYSKKTLDNVITMLGGVAGGGKTVSFDTETTVIDPLFAVVPETWDEAETLTATQMQQKAAQFAQDYWRRYYQYGGFSGLWGGGAAAVGAIAGAAAAANMGWSEPKPTEADMRRQRDVRCITVNDSSEVPPGKVAFTRGEGTYNARLRLRAMGGRWDKDLLGGVWLLPEAVIHEAAHAIRLAVKAGRELPVDDDPVVDADKITCYVCGERYTPWAFAKLTGAAVGEWYCGCEERKKGPAPRVATTRTR